MRKIVAGLFISLDGVVESPEKWHFPYFNDEMGEIVGSQMEQADAMLLGRRTYQEFAAHWPHEDPADNPFADRMNNTPKYVVTNTLDTAEWQNTTIIKGDVVSGLTELKQQPGKDIGITGSAALVRSLLADGLLDELRLLVHPIVVGSGKRLFEEGTGQIPLQLADSRTLSTGVLSLTYGRA
ncbi:dihydrofolate reductase family protein [Nonomuraea aurantiaca]|jgi:dihydrofolate reductase|uniref:dihydrofolate reductase family protein n=1 Tax=Nonomuraea aurantiaca TaxID=2878562 RepID=UPI001CD9C3B8|nr:dihydrofolate reductase family protein [Nonomuraea aurantiaca]MCA2223583.1 dihydrofolate reductase family protein [Nonomuraea aurantiaca]